ncbi:hypothetical protein EDC04DRAFT_2909404 [Pisolithus marmoratus]|nr:hypothetical protein EDC04DRAFT_2909404 [Pisolithus marmoratus]
MASPNLLSSQHVLDVHNHLMSLPSYLGKPSVSADFHWLHDGHGHILIHVPEAISDTIASASAPSSDDQDQTNSSPETPLSLPPNPAILSAIVCIDHKDFWLMSNGGYQGPNAVWTDILHVKLSCALSNPGIEPVLSDFPHMLQNLPLLTECCVTPGFTSGKRLFCTDRQGLARFKLHHKLFEVVDTDLASNEPGALPADLFSFELWPLTKEKNWAELLALKGSHHLPMPAYDIAGCLIMPSAY